MSWFTNLFTDGMAKVVDSVGSIINNVHTSEDEKLKAKRLVIEELNRFKQVQLQAQAAYDQEITKRWSSDNEHVVTRLVRPLSFMSVLVCFFIIIFTDGNIGEFSINPAYIPVVEGLLYTMVIAYFGSRGSEKITKTIQEKHKKPEQPDNRTPLQRNFDAAE